MRPGSHLGASSPPPTGNGRSTLSDRTLGQLLSAKVALLAYCRRCKHRSLLYPATLAEKLGAARPAVDVQQFLKCSECGARGETLRVTEVER
jgi:hypothetical protein